MSSTPYFNPEVGTYDSFARLRVSQDHTIFESKLIYDSEPLYWDQQILNGNTIITPASFVPIWNNGSVTLNANVTNGTRAIRQTYQRFSHQSGKSNLIFLSGILYPDILEDGTSRIGLFDDNDGIFIQAERDINNNIVCTIIKRYYDTTTNIPTDVSVPYSSWFIVNKPDATLFDATKIHTFYISYQSGGSQDITFGMLVGGRMIAMYTFFNNYTKHSANQIPAPPYIVTKPFNTPNLPIRYEVIPTLLTNNPTIICMGTSVLTEGGKQDYGSCYMIDRSKLNITISQNNYIYPALVLRLKSTSKSTNLFFDNLEILPFTQNVLYKWYIYANPVINKFNDVYPVPVAPLINYVFDPTNVPLNKNKIEYEFIQGSTTYIDTSVIITPSLNYIKTEQIIKTTNMRSLNEYIITGGNILLSGFGKGNTSIDLRNTLISKYTLGFSINGISNNMCIGIETINPIVSEETNFNVSLIVRETM